MKRLGVALLATLLFLTPAYAAGLGAGADNNLRDGILRTLIQLNLTDAQKREAVVILKNHREAGRQIVQNLQQAMAQLRQTMTATPDEAAVRAAFKNVAAAGEEAAVFRARLGAELQTILTPPQKKIWQERRAVMQQQVQRRIAAGRSLLDEWIEANTQ